MRCIICHKDTQGAQWLCPACQDQLERLSSPLAETYPYIDGVGATFAYRDAVRTGIHRMKFHHKTVYLDWFGAEIAQTAVELQAVWAFDCITYVPMSFGRWWGRGYNQSAVFAQKIAKRTAKPCVSTLWRSPFSAKQSEQKDAHARMRHANACFHPRKRMEVAGKTVLLVDDICTTGASAQVCAKFLKQAGAERVYLLCLARTE